MMDGTMQTDLVFKELGKEDIPMIAELGLSLNAAYTREMLSSFLNEMFALNSYHCFGLFKGDHLIAISSGWITVRFYCGKQLEVDNVLVRPDLQSQGIGAKFFEYIEDWARQAHCRSVELNTYVQNPRSHKFYFNQGHAIIGYHFQKKLVNETSGGDIQSEKACMV